MSLPKDNEKNASTQLERLTTAIEHHNSGKPYHVRVVDMIPGLVEMLRSHFNVRVVRLLDEHYYEITPK